MPITAIDMTEAIADGQYMLQQFRGDTAKNNQLSMVRAGLNVANYGAQFIVKDGAPPAPNPPAPTPNPPIMVEIAALPPGQVEMLQHLLIECDNHKIKKGQSGSLLSLVLAQVIPIVVTGVEAWLKAHFSAVAKLDAQKK